MKSEAEERPWRFWRHRAFRYGLLGLLAAPVAMFTPVGVAVYFVVLRMMQLVLGGENPLFFDVTKNTDVGYFMTGIGVMTFWGFYAAAFVVAGMLVGRFLHEPQRP
jgi:hypothetical protein